jgi:hypothetical protein
MKKVTDLVSEMVCSSFLEFRMMDKGQKRSESDVKHSLQNLLTRMNCRFLLSGNVQLQFYDDSFWPRLWLSGQSFLLKIQGLGFDSWRYYIFWEVGLERDPLSLVFFIYNLNQQSEFTFYKLMSWWGVVQWRIPSTSNQVNWLVSFELSVFFSYQ